MAPLSTWIFRHFSINTSSKKKYMYVLWYTHFFRRAELVFMSKIKFKFYDSQKRGGTCGHMGSCAMCLPTNTIVKHSVLPIDTEFWFLDPTMVVAYTGGCTWWNIGFWSFWSLQPKLRVFLVNYLTGDRKSLKTFVTTEETLNRFHNTSPPPPPTSA